MEPEIAFLMANLARVGPGTRILDPFTGCCTLLMAAAHLQNINTKKNININMIKDTTHLQNIQKKVNMDKNINISANMNIDTIRPEYDTTNISIDNTDVDDDSSQNIDIDNTNDNAINISCNDTSEIITVTDTDTVTAAETEIERRSKSNEENKEEKNEEKKEENKEEKKAEDNFLYGIDANLGDIKCIHANFRAVGLSSSLSSLQLHWDLAESLLKVCISYV